MECHSRYTAYYLFQCLAWASVQIQCECVRGAGAGAASSREDHVGAASGPKTSTGASSSSAFSHLQQSQSTSLHPLDWLEGSQVMSSSPKLLFCELTLGKHETKTFEYSELLPFDAPPSYRGKNIRFRYNLLVATQRVGASVEVFKVPFRVISASPFTAEAAAMAEAITGINSPMANLDGLQNGAARLLFENGTYYEIYRRNGNTLQFKLQLHTLSLGYKRQNLRLVENPKKLRDITS